MDERVRRVAEKAWCREFEEDEQMRVEDLRSRVAWDYAYGHNVVVVITWKEFLDTV